MALLLPSVHSLLETKATQTSYHSTMSEDNHSELEKATSEDADRAGSSRVSSIPAQEAPPEAPEGGTKAYLSLLGGSLGLFISFGWVNCIALFQAEYEENQLKSYSSSEISWITSSECMYLYLDFLSLNREINLV